MPPNYDNNAVYGDLKNVQLPPKLKCMTCKKIRKTEMFSNKQLNEVRYKVAKRYIRSDEAMLSGNIKCLTCTGGTTHELECTNCHSFKSLDDFSKSQRRQREVARCLDCVTTAERTDPGAAVPEFADIVAEHVSFTEQLREQLNVAGSSAGSVIANDTASEANTTTDWQSEVGGSSISRANSTAPASESGRASVPYYGTAGRSIPSQAPTTRSSSTAGVGPPEPRQWSHEDSGAIGQGYVNFTGFDANGNSFSKLRAPSSVAPSTVESSTPSVSNVSTASGWTEAGNNDASLNTYERNASGFVKAKGGTGVKATAPNTLAQEWGTRRGKGNEGSSRRVDREDDSDDEGDMDAL